MLKKIGLAVLYSGIALAIYYYHEAILTWFDSSVNAAWVMAAATAMALFPVIPYPIVGGVIGAAFGPALGAVITWVGSTAASLLMFLFVRYGYRDWGHRLLHSHKSVAKLTVMFENNAFLTILFARFIPFVPSIIINVFAALSRVSFAAYALASSLGKIPAMLLFALVGDSLMSNPANILITLGTYGLFLAVTLWLYRLWKNSRGLVNKLQEK